MRFFYKYPIPIHHKGIMVPEVFLFSHAKRYSIVKEPTVPIISTQNQRLLNPHRLGEAAQFNMIVTGISPAQLRLQSLMLSRKSIKEFFKMIRLYHGTGSQEIQLEEKILKEAVWTVTKRNAIQLLRAKRAYRAAELLSSIPFELYKGTNGFGDDFCVLYYGAPSNQYVEIAEKAESHVDSRAYQDIAEVFNETGYYVRFIALDVIADSVLPTVSTPNLGIRSDAVERALADAQQLIHGCGAPSGVDRIHTAFHGYLKAVAEKAKIQAQDNADITTLFSLLRSKHPAMQIKGPRADDVLRVARSVAAILDALNPLRNQASTAHPNEAILDEAEAMLVINAVKTLLHYLDAKFK